MTMFIFRDLLADLRRHLSKPEISLILGPRQSGKTTLIMKLADELKFKGERTAYFNLDRFEDLVLFKTQKTLLEKIRLEHGGSKVYVFVDEIQRLSNAGLFLKGLYDYLSIHKFIVTGSGSLELKENVVEPLTGRKKVFYLYPLSFAEFFRSKSGIDPKSFHKYFRLNRQQGERIVDEYLTFGGYPRVVLSETLKEKEEVLSEIYLSYIERDVKALLGVEKDFSYQALVKYLAAEIGSLFKKAEISRNLGLNIKTLNRYLFLLEKTFIIRTVRPFFQNPTKELTKTPKIYFLDLGLRNFIVGKLNSFFSRDDQGKIFENFVFRQILDQNPVFGVWFWRTEAGAEVDFVVREAEILPIEAKAGKQSPGVVGKGLLSFMEKYQAEKARIVHFGDSCRIVKNGKKIYYRQIIL